MQFCNHHNFRWAVDKNWSIIQTPIIQFHQFFYKLMIEKPYQIQFEVIEHKKVLCGCFIRNKDLIAMHPSKHILMPLKSLEYQIEIVNSIVNISLTQAYFNPTNQFLETEYTFPTNPAATIYKFAATFGDSRIEGVIKEKEQATKEYMESVKEGKKAAFGQINEESKDIFRVKIGNIEPQGIVKIEITFVQQLTLTLNTFYTLHLMGAITPRFIQYIPKEQVMKGFRNPEAKAKGNFYWNFNIHLKSSRKVTFFDSRSHDIILQFQNDSATQSKLVLNEKSLTNKDFIFNYTTEDFELPSYILGRTDLSSTAAISFIPKFCTLKLDDAYKASVTGSPYETDIESARGQYIFLLDRSGSMDGRRIEKAKQALILFIKSLPQDTYFNVVSFGSGYKWLFPQSLRYSDQNIKLAIKEVKKMGADLGGTQIQGALRKIFLNHPIDGYPKQIFLLTDGAVTNTARVIHLVQGNIKYSRVHTIGIGNGASEELIKGCALKGKGHHVFISDQEDPSEKIIQLLTDSLTPVITNISLKYDKSLVESIVPNPDSIPYILKNQIVHFYVTFKGQLSEKTCLSFSYKDTFNKKQYSSEILIDNDSMNQFFVQKMAQFKKIRILQEGHDSGNKVQDLMYYVKHIDKQAQAINLSIKHQILSKFTAFLCVQKVIVDGKYQQVKEKGQLKVIVDPIVPQEYLEKAPEKLVRLKKKRQMLEKKCSTRCMQRAQNSETQFLKTSVLRSKVKETQSWEKYIEDEEEQESEIYEEKMKKLYRQKQKQLKKDKREPVKKQKIEEKPTLGLPKSQLKQDSKKKSINIDDIISEQNSDGSWVSQQLFKLCFQQDINNIVLENHLVVAIITYLMAKWMEKHYPQKQYSLVIKKGLNFVKNKIAEFDKLAQCYDKYVK